MVTKRDRDKRFFLSSVCFKQRELNKGEQRFRINYSWDHSVVKRQSIKVDWNLIVFVERFFYLFIFILVSSEKQDCYSLR